jgi:cytidylate kinase
MDHEYPLIITISRLHGSGGSTVGRNLAEKLGILYLDREIIKKTAEKFGLNPEDLEPGDEKVPSRWQSIMNSMTYLQNPYYVPPESSMPTSREVFAAESTFIREMAQKNSLVVIGRCGSHVLRDHPKHVSIFLHATPAFRQQRLANLYQISEKEAARSVETTDKLRARYIHEFTGKEMHDARNYHLAVDTGMLGLEGTEDLIIHYLQTRFGDLGLAAAKGE